MTDHRMLWEKRVTDAMHDGVFTLPLVSCEVIRSTHEIVKVADLLAHYGVSVSVDMKKLQFPEGTSSHMKFAWSGWYAAPDDTGGMSPVSYNGNIGLYCLDTRNGEILKWTFGCDHAIVGVQAGRCYYKYNCTKCDFGYVIDSGD